MDDEDESHDVIIDVLKSTLTYCLKHGIMELVVESGPSAPNADDAHVLIIDVFKSTLKYCLCHGLLELVVGEMKPFVLTQQEVLDQEPHSKKPKSILSVAEFRTVLQERAALRHIEFTTRW